MRQIGWVVLLAFAATGCSVRETPVGDASPAKRDIDRNHHLEHNAAVPGDDDPAADNQAFGNVQPQHVREAQYHQAVLAYGPRALLVCNTDLQGRDMLDDLRKLVGREAILLANDNSTFVPLWGTDSEMWNAYRAAMDPATVGLPESAWYWLDEHGERIQAPMPCWHGWCGDYWPGWALKPEKSAYRAKAEFLAAHADEFDGIWLDEWHEGFSRYQIEGLGIPPAQQPWLSRKWVVCRRFYVDLLRDLVPPDFLLVPNLQPARHASYAGHEMRRFDGHTTEFPDVIDLARFRRFPSPYNVGWSGDLDAPGIVRVGHGLPANVDP